MKRDHAGMAVVAAAEWRWARWLTAAATLWLLLVACHGLFGPMLAGHYASSASVGIIGENMLRWQIAGPVWSYSETAPPPSAYYCHHPWGIFWTGAAFMKLFGRHDFVCRLPAVVASVLTVPLLYKLGSALWRPLAGAVAALAFVTLPITLSFAHFNALEVPVMAWSTLGLWGTVRYLRQDKRRYLLAGAGGLLMAMHMDWPAFMLVGLLLGAALLRPLLPRASERIPERRLLRWWMWTATAAVLTGLLYVALFHRSGKLTDLLQSYDLRSRGRDLPLGEVLKARSYWIELMFTPLAVGLGKLGALLLAARLLLLRRATAWVALAVLLMASGQYLLFKQGADVHIFWPHYFALFFALALGALANTLLSAAQLLARRRPALRPWLRRAAPLLLLPLAMVLRDGVEAAGYARASGGRFNEKGLYIDSDGDKTALLAHIAEQLPAHAQVALHPSMRPTWSQVWTLGGRVVPTHVPKPATHHAAFVADTRFTSDALQQAWLRKHDVRAAGPYWWITPGGPPALKAQSLVPQRRRLLRGYLFGLHEPDWLLADDAFARWELAYHFERPAPPPDAEPQGPEPLRIAHNLAIASGETAHAARHRAALLAHYQSTDIGFGPHARLLGSRYQDGLRPELWLLFEAAGPLRAGLRPALRARVIAPAALSTTMADPTVREVGPPPALKPIRWRRGMLYRYRATVRKRPGTELFELYFRDSAGPRVASAALTADDGRRYVQVLRLPR